MPGRDFVVYIFYLINKNIPQNTTKIFTIMIIALYFFNYKKGEK